MKSIFLILALLLIRNNGKSQDIHFKIAARDSIIDHLEPNLFKEKQFTASLSQDRHFKGFTYSDRISNKTCKIIVLHDEKRVDIYFDDTTITKIIEPFEGQYYFFGDQIFSKKGNPITQQDILDRLTYYKTIFRKVSDLF